MTTAAVHPRTLGDYLRHGYALDAYVLSSGSRAIVYETTQKCNELAERSVALKISIHNARNEELRRDIFMLHLVRTRIPHTDHASQHIAFIYDAFSVAYAECEQNPAWFLYEYAKSQRRMHAACFDTYAVAYTMRLDGYQTLFTAYTTGVVDYVSCLPITITMRMFLMCFLDCAMALRALHASDIVHNDIHGNNIVVRYVPTTRLLRASIVDFDCALDTHITSSNMFTCYARENMPIFQKGRAFIHLPPERQWMYELSKTGKPYTFCVRTALRAGDVFMLAHAFHDCFKGRHNTPNAIYYILSSMMCADYTRRCTADEVVQQLTREMRDFL